ncbi:MAG TPA: hypothetical protein DDW52_09365 [Planctomycetaceae bacterium]|nr:hypothetical protein [Planctomycetaceae bacterium]
MSFAYPWLWLLLPAPFILRYIWTEYAQGTSAVRIPMFELVRQATGSTAAPGASVRRRPWWAGITYTVCWTSIVCALARPQRLLPPETRDLATRDMLLAIDLSGSMETRDFVDQTGQSIDRLEAVKGVLTEFLTERRGDRVGMIVFGTGAFVQIPFTQDLDVCRELTNDLDVRMAGPKTALGDAIGLAINVFQRSELEDKVLIALTDGNDTGSRIPPADAAKIAADNGIVIHTIGVGDPEAAGEEVLDEKALREMASSTGGQYFFAADREALAGVYSQIDALDSREVQQLSHRPTQDLFSWPLGFALIISALAMAIAMTSKSRRVAADEVERTVEGKPLKADRRVQTQQLTGLER